MSEVIQLTDDTVFVVSAPSGAGKTTLNRRLSSEFANQIEISVSLTTRSRRPGENDGEHYHFVSRGQFEASIHARKMLEWANVHGNLYGTSIEEMTRIRSLGKRPLLEIDVQGWEQARSKLPRAVSIFILPPSMRHLWHRLERRGTDSFDHRWHRMMNARAEIAAATHYQFFIINDEIEHAYQQLKSIVIEGRAAGLDQTSGKLRCDQLLAELDSQEFLNEIKSR